MTAVVANMRVVRVMVWAWSGDVGVLCGHDGGRNKC